LKSVLHVITGLESGGAEGVLYRLAITDKEARHIVVSLMGMGKYGSMFQEQGIDVFCLDMPKGKITRKGIETLRKIVMKERPDIMQTWMYHADLLGGMVGRSAGIKNIFWGIRTSTLISTSLKTMMVARLCAWLSYIIPKKIVCCAKNAMQVNVQLGYCKSKFELIPNGYNLAQFYPQVDEGKGFRKKFNIDPNALLIGMVARFDAQKDIQNFIKAAGSLAAKDIRFHVLFAGQGMDSNNEQLQAWLEEAGISGISTLVGQQNNIPEVMNAFDLLVLSSKSGEAFPNVLAEAMACGVPCVATRIGDAEYIMGDTGWAVDPENSEQLASAIEKAISLEQNAEAWKLQCEKCRMRVAGKFSMEKMIGAYHRVWGIK
jgi:glycosyltransferase involved in cell wall biosynthesis